MVFFLEYFCVNLEDPVLYFFRPFVLLAKIQAIALVVNAITVNIRVLNVKLILPSIIQPIIIQIIIYIKAVNKLDKSLLSAFFFAAI